MALVVRRVRAEILLDKSSNKLYTKLETYMKILNHFIGNRFRRQLMSKKFQLLILSAIIAVVIPCLTQYAAAFELFPRPEGQYTVQRGDTLYGIAGAYYANPALWPFLWNQNPALSIKGGSPEQQPLTPGTKIDLYQTRYPYPAMNQSYMPPTGLPEDARFLITKVPYQGIPYDKRYFRYKLTLRPTQLWGYIVSAPDQIKENYLERDLVYIRFRPSKKQAILVGDRFGIYRDRGPLNHPLNPDRAIGFMSEIVGEVEVTSTGNNLATAIILDSYVEIKRSDKICLFTPRSREIVPSKTHMMLTGTILASATGENFLNETSSLENDIVFIDRGECHGMREGMLLNIYRPPHPVTDPFFHRWISTPDKYVGEGMILKAFEKNATVLITTSREEIVPGDIIKSVSD